MTSKSKDDERDINTKKLIGWVMLISILTLMIVLLSGVSFGLANFFYHLRIDSIERGNSCLEQRVACTVREGSTNTDRLSCSTDSIPINITVSCSTSNQTCGRDREYRWKILVM